MKKNKVLDVEDELFLGRIVKDSLESREFEVMMVDDGAEVMNAFDKFKPDICVLDIMLPHKDGYEIAKEIRIKNKLMPILFLTAKTQTEDLIKGFQTGGNDYVRKPFSLEELIVRLNNLLELTNGKPNNTNNIFKIGSYTFNPSNYELSYNETINKLSYRESELLKTYYSYVNGTKLCEGKNAIIQRKDILMRLWGDDSFFNSRNLDVYVTKLRAYLKNDSSIQIISIKGVGYHFLCG